MQFGKSVFNKIHLVGHRYEVLQLATVNGVIIIVDIMFVKLLHHRFLNENIESLKKSFKARSYVKYHHLTSWIKR